jgi:hypothetical protein
LVMMLMEIEFARRITAIEVRQLFACHT